MVTHITVGLTIGTLVFGLISVIFRRVRLKLTAWHCAVLAFVSIVPDRRSSATWTGGRSSTANG